MFSRYASQLPGRPRRARLGLEPLDSRVVPAVVLTQLDLDGDGATDDIRIVGDLRNNKITIHDNGQASVEIQVDGNGDGDTLDAGDLFQSFNFTNDSLVLEVNLGGGNDSFQYFVDQNFDASARTLAVNLGAGNDAFVWQMNNHQVGPQSRIALDVTAGGGADKVNVTFDKVMTSVASVHADLGAGVDTYDLAFGRIDNKASVDVDTELGAGPNTNTVAFQGIGIFDKAEMDMTIVGGPQKDTVDLQMLDDVGNGVLASQAVVSVDLLAGDDVFKGSLDSGGNIFRVDDHSLASISVRGG
ncbi:MAG TPA: hypothetical protein VKE40_14630, partial [Gemmataceae bacterium]|nr:hypothetical protein [Gemmataceae bacterium]